MFRKKKERVGFVAMDVFRVDIRENFLQWKRVEHFPLGGDEISFTGPFDAKVWAGHDGVVLACARGLAKHHQVLPSSSVYCNFMTLPQILTEHSKTW